MVKSKDVPVVIEALGAVTPTLEGWLDGSSRLQTSEVSVQLSAVIGIAKILPREQGCNACVHFYYLLYKKTTVNHLFFMIL